MEKTKRFYIISLAVLIVLSAYPLINGIRIAYLSIANRVIEPDQYAKYVVPYTAICISTLWFAAMQPVFMKLKRLAFPVGIITAFGLFLVIERCFEMMQMRVSGMMLLEPSALAVSDPVQDTVTMDLWQALSCAVSPVVRQESLTYEFQDRLVYVMADGTYKIHYYIISLLLITMVSGVVYSIAKMLRNDDRTQTKAVLLRGISTAALLALCVFANTTAFFRQAAPIQTPIASILTGLFFVVLGVSAGVYAGSYLMNKGKRFSVMLPSLVAVCATVLMYIGEAAMMSGGLYQFGRGWFFRGLSGITLAPVDILIVLLSGAITWLVLSVAGRSENRPLSYS